MNKHIEKKQLTKECPPNSPSMLITSIDPNRLYTTQKEATPYNTPRRNESNTDFLMHALLKSPISTERGDVKRELKKIRKSEDGAIEPDAPTNPP
ncbi:hypothetical protein NERG_00250 [Nematocida ausubeli]|uniref:Uncharacterized protein n=1 Tax=Nematocida ausubeli (strain ATCC PRA-371 / ERTm2) TaxID=1913371 RepID=H8Z9H9_NEMA1|nr:hypothetical protein NERG_00250 [Nematocida ausubeli]